MEGVGEISEKLVKEELHQRIFVDVHKRHREYLERFR